MSQLSYPSCDYGNIYFSLSFTTTRLVMKSIFKKHFSKQPQQIISALVLTGILSLNTSLTLLQPATATPKNLPQGYAQAMPDDRTNRLPHPVANAVRQNLSYKVGIPVSKLRITGFSRETWPNGCLGLPKPNELCTRALVEGWRITLSNGRQTWVYRTDSKGRAIRLENQTASAELPAAVTDAVLQDASRRLKLPISSLRVVKAERRTWPDGCLGLGSPGIVCTQALVPGWQVIVEGGKERLVYRTGESGKVRLDEAASHSGDAGNLKPI
jgi:hypothetical protein